MKAKRIIALGLSVLMLAGIAGCGNTVKDGKNKDGKVVVSVGNWPDETRPEDLADMNRIKDEFNAANPDIEIVSDTYRFDTKTFVMKASANQLPTMFSTFFTEISSIIKNGNAADITEELKEMGWYDAMNPELLDLVKSPDGKIYGVPTDAYAQGLYINKKLYTEAGLVNEDGSLKVPTTYEELAQNAQIIKEKTGKAGYIFPTMNNCGGWHFLNFAWAYGAEFETQDADGKWKVAFDTPETREALQFIKDLKWKYNALADESTIDYEKMFQFFGTNQGAMVFANPPGNFVEKYGMNIDDIYVCEMPAGPKGRFSQMGGNLYMFEKNATHEQILAGLKWLEHVGKGPTINDEQAKSLSTTYAEKKKMGAVVLDKDAFDVWTNEETIAKKNSIRKEYTNVDPANYEKYYAFEGVTIKPEPAAACQELYAVLDGCIQEVITNKDADVDKLISEAAKDFQANHLDKME